MHVRHDAFKGDAFMTELRRVIDGSSTWARNPAHIDATGFVFPNESRLALEQFTWNRPAIFRGARFYTLLFHGARFESEVDFSDAVFISTYGGAEFCGPAIFRRADFDTFRMKGAVFRAIADFSGAKTLEDSYLQGCTFHAEALFEAITTGELHCHNTEFRGPVVFRNARLRHAGGFSSVKFRGAIDARGLHVSHVTDGDPFIAHAGEADFAGATFQSEMSFRGTLFTGLASFREATFAAGVAFTSARFDRDCAFNQCKFGGSADFSNVKFGGSADFARSHFGTDVAFSDTVFVGIADFEACRFSEPSKVHFVRVNDTSDVGVRFRLADTSLDAVHFEGVHWFRRGGRLVLQDELDDRSLTARQAESVESAYRRLYATFHRTYRYSDAEDCVMGAMEMRRRNPRVDRLTRAVMLLYRLASFYGSSYRRAFGGLLLIVLGLFPALYMLPSSHLRQRGVATDFFPRHAHRHSQAEANSEHMRLTLADGFRLYRAAAYYSTELSAFRDEPSFVLESPLRGLVFVEQALVASQLALLLLAVRRRFAQ